ncbi:hypothetical protein [Campylobacter sp. RM9328]|uniref:hypothetical protein n=1 Tax=Campylobacter sp. RM9328 TaxID=1705720 RepID=UPI001474B8E5|nr:hypothetical protein [Campylobacter sp. RM9328]
MQNIDEKLKAKLLKLQALVKQGVGGESRNAKDILEKLLKKHNIDINLLLDETRTKKYFFGYKTEFEKNMLFRIFLKIRNNGKSADVRYTQRNKTIGLELSEYEFVEFEILKDGYFKNWKRYLKMAQTAFIHASELFIVSEDSINDNKEKLSPAKRAELFEIARMCDSVPEAEFKRNLLK